ncbi:winged helix-turn-helix domain-containing protein [Rhodopseudomonas palustris]|uniref:winged helix-turn-helix domain-containing protein n=1 Tax=Rhodopseudomonas palustris TaxID=1076 RepID=UPI0021F30074|nr:winged helix-turn-helix domain-containing protein [Rhodopseudomonas palustris]UYO55697.1 winged helix-turn-helix domain-containing protein [Rhodopseudomonas palustris]
MTLTMDDLKIIEGSVRVADLRLARALGIGKPIDIRRLINRRRVELAAYGALIGAPAPGKRTADSEYWLNEQQALVICVLGNFPQSAAVHRELIDLFAQHRLTLLRECRLIFGRRAAAKLWRQLGLPAVAGDEPAARASRADEANVDQVKRFIAASTARRPGAQVQSSVLYSAYRSWCESTGIDVVLTQTMFSLIMGRLGFAKRCSSVMFWTGLALVNHLAAVPTGEATGRLL